jgi:hypothetical protein
MNRRHLSIVVLLGLALLLSVAFLIAPQAAWGQGPSPLGDEREDGTGIYGQVTYQGVPTGSIELALQRCDYTGSYWLCSASPVAITTTQADGSYEFIGVPSLGVDQKYGVRYRNSLHDPN